VVSVVFIFAFLFLYVMPLSSVFGGKAAFNRCMEVVNSFPMISFLEIAFVMIPLLIHTAFAFFSMYGSSINIVKYNSYRNWVYTIRRLSGILLVPFVAYHVFATTVKFAFTGKYIDFSYMHALLSSTGIKAFYAVGIACAIFYMTSGIVSLAFEWGVTVSRKSRDIVSIMMWCIAIALFAWSMRIILAF